MVALKASIDTLAAPMMPKLQITANKAVTSGKIIPCQVLKASKCTKPINTSAIGNK